MDLNDIHRHWNPMKLVKLILQGLFLLCQADARSRSEWWSMPRTRQVPSPLRQTHQLRCQGLMPGRLWFQHGDTAAVLPTCDALSVVPLYAAKIGPNRIFSQHQVNCWTKFLIDMLTKVHQSSPNQYQIRSTDICYPHQFLTYPSLHPQLTALLPTMAAKRCADDCASWGDVKRSKPLVWQYHYGPIWSQQLLATN